MNKQIRVAQKRFENDREETEYIKGPVDMPFLILVLLLLGIGLIMMFSASYAVAYYNLGGNSTYYIYRQAACAAGGIAIMFIISRIRVGRWRFFAIPVLAVSIILLAAVPFIGTTINEATRWIDIKITTFQPSEVAKLGVILCFSHFAVAIGPERMKTFKFGIMPFLALLGVISGLLYLEPHLSATVIIVVTGMVIIFVGGASIMHLIGLGGLAAAGGVAFILEKPYAMTRIKVWLDPFIDPLDKGWQAVQSFIAIGSGGFWGIGLGQSRQKHLYLPEPANDFIFSVVCEELGFIGAILILSVFAALILRGYWIAMRARDRFGCLIAVGVTTQIAVQTTVNIFVVSGLMPVTGAALPFFSYGGTSLIILLAEVGLILGVSRDIMAPKQG